MFKIKKILLYIALAAICAFGFGAFAACKKGSAEEELAKNPPAAVNAETITFDGTNVEWQAVPGATSYTVNCNGYQATAMTNKYTSVIGSTVTEVTIKLVAKNAAGQSEETGKVFYRLATINLTDDNFDEDGELSWDHVEGAVGYLVNINGQEKQVGAANAFSEFEYGKTNTVKVKPLGESNTFSSYGTSIKKTYLAAPGTIKYDGESITWNGIPSATGYNLYINGIPYNEEPIKKSPYNYTAEGTTFKIALQAIGDGKNSFSSQISESITCTKLEDVRNVTVVDGFLTWDPVVGANSYEVKINNSPKIVKECKLDIAAGTSYSVTVKPLATSSDFYFSVPCAPVSIYVLKAPVLKWNSELSLDGEAQNSLYWDNADNAGGYKVKVKTPSGKEEVYDATTGAPHLTYAYLETGVYELSVSTVNAEPGLFPSKYSEVMKVRRLAAPKLLPKDAVKSRADNFDEGFTLNYSPAEGANGYAIYREGTLENTTQNTSITIRKVLNDNQTVTSEINYKIRSTGIVTGKEVKLDSLTSQATEVKITVLPTPTNVRMDGSSVKWDSVSGASATGYRVKTDAETMPAVNNEHNFRSLAAGEHTISVCAAGNGAEILASPYSTGIRVRKLAAPSNIKVDTKNDNGQIAYEADKGATAVMVYFNGSKTGIDASEMDNISTYVSQGSQGVSVVLEAVANYLDSNGVYLISSDYSQTKQFTKINTVIAESAEIRDYQLIWRAPDNISATASGKISYRIYDAKTNYVLATTDGAVLDLSSYEGSLEEYQFNIVCIGDGEVFFNSDKSDSIVVRKLENVDLQVSATLDGYTWEGVGFAEKYVLAIDGKAVVELPHTGTGSYTVTSDKFAALMAAPATYKVTVVAVGNPLTMVMDSAETVKMQTVKRLTTPEVTLSYTAEQVSKDGRIKAEITQAIDNAAGYEYQFDGMVVGTKFDGDMRCEYNAPTCKQYKVVVAALGGKFDGEGNYYCKSLNSEEKSITLLSAPRDIEINKDNILTWKGEASADYGYTLIIEFSDGTTEPVEKVDKLSYKIPSGKKVVSVKIRANGNGKTTITSEYATKRFD